MDRIDEDRELFSRARSGDPGAQFDLAWNLFEQKDFPAARRWYELAAAQGDLYAAYNLGSMIWNGEGCEADKLLALSYFRRAAPRPGGWFDYAAALEEVASAPEEWKEVAACYRRARCPAADFNLGILCEQGRPGIPKDARRAVRYYRRAADAGDAEAACNLGACYQFGTGVRKDLKKSFFYSKFAADRGDSMAFLHVGEDYCLGNGVRRNYRKAFDWFRRAWFARPGGAAAGWIGDCYMRGRGVKRDWRKAYLWQKRAAKLGDARSWFELGIRLIHGEGTGRNPEASRRAFLRYLEFEPGDTDAVYWLGQLDYPGGRALEYFEFVHEKERDPWSAYRIVRLKLLHCRNFSPPEFAELERLLRFAARKRDRTGHRVPDARRLLESRRWRMLRKRFSSGRAGCGREAAGGSSGNVGKSPGTVIDKVCF